MFFLKLLTPVLVPLIIALQIALDYKWHDKRTITHRRVRRFLLYVLGLTALVTVLIVIGDNRSVRQTQTQLDNLQKTLHEAKKERSILLERLGALSFEVTSDEMFKPLEPQIRQIALKALRSFSAKVPASGVRISVNCDTGNRNRQLLAQELVKLLKEAGVDTEGPTFQMTFSSDILPPVRIKVNPDDEQLARRFAAAVSPVFRSQFNGVRDNQVKPGQIVISIFGEPLFHPDGSVTFK